MLSIRIYFAYIGCVEAEEGVSFIGILLQRNHCESSIHDEGCFYRVILGDKSLLTSSRVVFCGDRKIKTVRIRRHTIHRIRDVVLAGEIFEFKILYQDYNIPGIQLSGFVRPGLLCSASRHDQLSAGKQLPCPTPKIQHRADTLLV